VDSYRRILHNLTSRHPHLFCSPCHRALITLSKLFVCLRVRVPPRRYSSHLLFPDRGRRRGTHDEGEDDQQLSAADRHLLRVGLLLALAQVPGVRRVHRVRPVCRAVHHAVHRRQHAVHGARPPRHEQGHGEGVEERQLCEFSQVFLVTVGD
jgi:hypothetical protein